MNRTLTIVGMFAILAAGVGCSSGGSGGGPVQSGLSAGFVADQPSPAADTVNASTGSANNDMITVQINVTDTAGVYSAGFDLIYDPNQVTYSGWSPGALLEQGGFAGDYLVSEIQPGQLVVSAGRVGNVPGANASGTVPVIRITFRVDQVGSSNISFQANNLLDDQQQPHPSIAWFGGSLTGI